MDDLFFVGEEERLKLLHMSTIPWENWQKINFSYLFHIKGEENGILKC